MPRIIFCYDFVTPVAYLAAREMQRFGERHRLDILWLPVLSAELKELSTRDPAAAPHRRCRGVHHHVKRWAEMLGVPFQMRYPAIFDPVPALLAAQGVRDERRVTLTLAIFEDLWSGNARPEAEGWVGDVCSSRGLPEEWGTPAHPGALSAQLRHNTGVVFGAGIHSVPGFLLQAGRKTQAFRGLEQVDLMRWSLVNQAGAPEDEGSGSRAVSVVVTDPAESGDPRHENGASPVGLRHILR
ncbi:MAG: DsbA family protein [Nitrospirota bacterium]|jgi:2-hydroxychromene-2-carboxylate isomerase